MAIVPEERSNTMIKIIEGEELQVQMMNLQKEAPASGVPDERTALKLLVRLAKLCLLYDTVFPRIDFQCKVKNVAQTITPENAAGYIYIDQSLLYHDFSSSGGQAQIPRHAGTVTRLVHLLVAVPCLQLFLGGKEFHSAAIAASVGLRALNSNRARWDALLQPKGLSANKMEELLRFGLSHALHEISKEECMNHQEEARINKGRLENMQRMKELNPTLPWNCFSAAAHQLAKNDPLQAMQEILPALISAEQQGDDLKACRLRWKYCHLMLLTGSRPGHITVSDFLKHVDQGKQCKARLDSWGEFPCAHTGGWTPVPSISLALPDTYWDCLGISAHFKAAIKRDPAFAATELPAFTEAALKEARMHVRCHYCQELNGELMFCSRCHVAKYCSRDCQKRHWISVHKQLCIASAS